MEHRAADGLQENGWIKRSQQGDAEAFGRLVELHQHRVFSVAYHLIRRPEEVEDLVQEVFVKAFVAIRSFGFQASFGTWLSRITVNHCYDYLRHRRGARVTPFADMSEDRQRALERRFERPEAGASTDEDKIAARELAAKLLDRAAPDDRIILTLRELDGMSIEEIGQVLRIRPTNVKVRLRRARKRLMEDLKRLREGK